MGNADMARVPVHAGAGPALPSQDGGRGIKAGAVMISRNDG
jgi:hypothetical protein